MNQVEMNRCFAGAQKPPAAGRGVVALLLLFSALSATALTNTATGLVYEEASGEATVTGYTGAGGDVAIPATLGGYPVTVVGPRAFFTNNTITSVTIPDSVQVIGISAFIECSALESVDLGAGVTSIGSHAFLDCTVLASITIPDNIQSIGSQVFERCTALESVEIGTGVTSISVGMFFNCSALASITIPGSVESIGALAFFGCSALEAVYFEGDAPSLGSDDVFGSTPATIYYRSGTSGWGSMFRGRPTAIGRAVPQILGAGVRDGGQFGFEVQWTDGQEAVMEASDDLAGGVWSPVSTNTIPAAGSVSFEEATVPESRFYRVRSK